MLYLALKPFPGKADLDLKWTNISLNVEVILSLRLIRFAQQSSRRSKRSSIIPSYIYNNQNQDNYSKFGEFRENFNFVNGIKRHISDVKYSQLRHDLPMYQ